MMSRLSRLRPAMLSVATASLLGLALLSCQTAPVANRTASSDTSDVVLFQDVMRRVERSYVEPVNRDKLLTDALKRG